MTTLRARPRTETANTSPVSEAAAGRADAVTPPRKTRAAMSIVKPDAVPVAAIAAVQRATLAPSSRVRRRRSTSTPAGSVPSPPTTLKVLARTPICVFESANACLSAGASAPDRGAIGVVERDGERQQHEEAPAVPPAGSARTGRSHDLIERPRKGTGRSPQPR